MLGVITNKPPTGAYRGAGGPEAAFCMERTIDLIAQELGLDPADAATAAFDVMRTRAARNASDPWAVVTRAVQLTLTAGAVH